MPSSSNPATPLVSNNDARLSISPLPTHHYFVSVVSARDAWIQADINRYGGANKCLLWKAFASRGLGVNAANYNDDSTVPAGC